ncbi:MAG: hypothetical protein OK441_03715 [Thaumarchaeota archaeon]|nr:hypothetical protein [Nitrososphaerota archaeon]
MRLGIRRYLPELSKSGLSWVIAAFLSLIVVNLATFGIGRTEILIALNSNPAGALLAPFVFDSWGTIGGLGGVVLLFSPVLFGTPVSQRRPLSVFFVTSSIVIGVFSALLWDAFYDSTGLYGSGSSSIAISAQGVIFALSFFGILRLARQDTRHLGTLSSHWWYSFAIIYSTLILTSLWFVLSLEPIFIPTLLYNWRVHEFGFLFAAAATAVYVGWRWSDLGLDGVVRIDEMLMNYHFDDLSVMLPVRIPKYRVLFGKVRDSERVELRPELGEIWVSEILRDVPYSVSGKEFERELRRVMVRAALLAEGKNPEDGTEETARRLEEIAAYLGQPPGS